ncbi:hypothetical protein Micbo1qcDRAFT_235001 [Microdochium bolleyi]|uniref:Impact N-terminal domain-containing protein n=1 Tax=Microdochium bolleyi TaxID=196109 RepID=A0A136IXR3_9PEZI|nr:hypothetical protein Micbo1qcDRAFT_235001 [Microdochium bolleyi]
MASQSDLQDLLRLMTTAKVPIKDAMMRIKLLQGSNLRSIQQIAESPLSAVEAAIKDQKAARSLHNACKARLKQINNPDAAAAASKRSGPQLSGSAKRQKGGDGALFTDGPEAVSPEEAEAAFSIPVETDESVIASTTLLTNRAPLVLAFAAELLRYTMPEQPPSSRLSLAQAVVSANSRSKAVSIGLEKGLSADEEGWGHGQPRVRVLGREVAVLKRGGYSWKGEEKTVKQEGNEEPSASIASSATATNDSQSAPTVTAEEQEPATWSASQPVTLKESTFIVRAIPIAKPSERAAKMQELFARYPSLKDASHNAWAYRVNAPTNLFGATTIKEDSFDDGESGCGSFLIKNMREMDTVDMLVVMTRWYGGIMLGPDRWRIMRDCLKNAVAGRLRVSGRAAQLGGEAVWGLDLEAMKSTSTAAASGSRSYEAGVVGMPIHRPEAAMAYLLKSFATRVETSDEVDEVTTHTAPVEEDGTETTTTTTTTPRKGSVSSKPKTGPKRKTTKVLDMEKEENVGRLLGALRLLFDSWADHLSTTELDRRAWSWYVAVRPEVESGPSGWGAKGHLRLQTILDLRRRESS